MEEESGVDDLTEDSVEGSRDESAGVAGRWVPVDRPSRGASSNYQNPKRPYVYVSTEESSAVYNFTFY